MRCLSRCAVLLLLLGTVNTEILKDFKQDEINTKENLQQNKLRSMKVNTRQTINEKEVDSPAPFSVVSNAVDRGLQNIVAFWTWFAFLGAYVYGEVIVDILTSKPPTASPIGEPTVVPSVFPTAPSPTPSSAPAYPTAVPSLVPTSKPTDTPTTLEFFLKLLDWIFDIFDSFTPSRK